MKFFKCNKCGHVMLSVNEKSESITCCGSEARLLKAGEVDAALEKHVPAYNLDGDKLEVVIGEVIHPMEADHYIEFIALQTEKGFRIEYLQPGDKPCADFYSEEPVKAVYEFCNLHGLWKTES